ncbi:ABC transporter substrate-binding protein [Sinorhizobium sp. 7-81]|uniref:ABC transporter substrate-binding protein n=1 Tax=Sinorhizobium sp. 8-89 TaxID=3049089 RepID=UPI0024C30D8B|nr:ABC transporter substrate-binding protein [Sinorhizobium sp. 8-89]MDK1494291.1 ABC transporter substrate-binding protein [Sinorhizobium sp. 8-89]
MTTSAKTIALCAAILVSGLPVAAQAGEIPENLKGTGEVVVATAGGAFEEAERKAWFEPFTRDTGIRVVTIPSSPKLLASAKLGQPEADISNINGGEVPSWIANNALEKIDYSYFSKDTLAGLPDFMKEEYGLGSFFYSVVVAYSTKSSGDHPKNWVDFYDVKKFPGKRTLPNCDLMLYGGLLEGALVGDGVAPEKLYPLDMDRAFAKLAAIKPNVGRWWATGADAPQSLIGGEVDMAAAWNGRIITAKKQGAPLELSWDQSLLQYDDWIVLKNAPNKDNASKLLAYISRAEAQAAFAEAIPYGPVNKDAFKLLPKELVDVLPGGPDIVKKQIVQDYKWWVARGADGRTNYDVAMERCIALLTQ